MPPTVLRHLSIFFTGRENAKGRNSKLLRPFFVWCARKDLNLHTSRHQNLNLACLPIPPLAQWAAILAGYRLITSPASRLTALQNTVKRLQILIDFADPVLQRTQPGIILL